MGDKVKADPAGFTAHKFGFPHSGVSRVLTTRELIDVGKGYENCREAIGWDHDIMVHCHWEYDLRTAIQIAEAVEPIKADVVRRSSAGGVFRSLAGAARGVACSHLHGRNLSRGRDSRTSSFIRAAYLHPDCATAAGFWKPSASPTWRRCMGCRWRRIIRGASCIRGELPVGGVDPRFSGGGDDHGSGRMDGSADRARRSLYKERNGQVTGKPGWGWH